MGSVTFLTMPPMKTRIVRSGSPAETRAIARRLAQRLDAGAVVALFGPLGAGKTEFVRGAALGLGVSDVVRSPGYTLINEYRGRVPVFHVDFYRIRSESQMATLGLEEYLERGGVLFIEWAERGEGILPESAIRVRFSPGERGNERIIEIAPDPWAEGG